MVEGQRVVILQVILILATMALANDTANANICYPGSAASHDSYDHPSTKIWSVYMSEATPHDRALIDSWSKDMDGILIFVRQRLSSLPAHTLKLEVQAGLFSASVTAFIIESYNGLMPDPNQQTIALLQQISQQLGSNPAQSQVAASDGFRPTSSTLRVNAFWFLSLCLALTCALAATLVQQWYDSANLPIPAGS